MDKASKRFASWVLAIHMIVLAILVVIVFFASRDSYYTARRQALDQLGVRQELLAAQTARGVESFFRGILGDMAMAKQGAAMKIDVGPLIWEQLSGRASGLVQFDRSQKVVRQFGDIAAPQQLKPGITASSRELVINSDSYAATIPVGAIESRFLNDLSQPENMGAMLLDDSLRVVSAEQRELVGVDMSAESIDPRIKSVIDEYVKRSQRGTREFLEPLRLNNVSLPPAIVTVQPVDLPDGKKWWLAVSSNLSDVESSVGGFFWRTIIGSGLVVIAMTAVLLSTSIQMIRGRLRLERIQTDLITRELGQAREIQLMWLPNREHNKVAIDVAAMNKPASHVSGDFYNWFELDETRVAVVVGDVTGHGLPAAFLMATTQLLVRVTLERVGDPGATLRYVNKQLCEHVFSGQFVTMIVLVIDTQKNTAEIATAGHPPPMVGDGHDFRMLSVDPQLVLAIDHDVPYRTQRVDLAPGSSILLYTDGVTDIQSPAGARLESEGLLKCVYGRFDNASTLLQATSDAIESFRAGRESSDDVTLVAVQLSATPTEPSESPDELDSRASAATVK